MAGIFNSQEPKTDKLIVCLDLGTQMIKALAAIENRHGERSILGVEEIQSDGIKRGIIMHPSTVSSLIKKILGRLENKINRSIGKVYVTTGGINLQLKRNKVYRHNTGRTFSATLIDEMEEENQQIFNPHDTEILLVEPQGYIIDGEMETDAPIGAVGNRIDGEYLVVAAPKRHTDNIRATLKMVGLEAEIIPAAYASALGIIDDREMEMGAVVIDMGAGVSQLAVFHGKKLIHMVAIPLAGKAISNDLKNGWNLHADQAELLKCKYGTAIPELVEEAQISLKSPRQNWPDKTMMRSVLTFVVASRLEEMFNIFMNQIESTGYFDRLGTGIVITGGSSNIQDLIPFVERNTGLSSCKSRPVIEYRGPGAGKLHQPDYAALLGLMQEADDDCERREGFAIFGKGTRKEAPQKKKPAKKHESKSFMKDLFDLDTPKDVAF